MQKYQWTYRNQSINYIDNKKYDNYEEIILGILSEYNLTRVYWMENLHIAYILIEDEDFGEVNNIVSGNFRLFFLFFNKNAILLWKILRHKLPIEIISNILIYYQPISVYHCYSGILIDKSKCRYVFPSGGYIGRKETLQSYRNYDVDLPSMPSIYEILQYLEYIKLYNINMRSFQKK